MDDRGRNLSGLRGVLEGVGGLQFVLGLQLFGSVEYYSYNSLGQARIYGRKGSKVTTMRVIARIMSCLSEIRTIETVVFVYMHRRNGTSLAVSKHGSMKKKGSLDS